MNFVLNIFSAAAPSFTNGAIAPDEVTNAVVSGTISLRCKPIGSPKPQIFWFKGLTRLSSNGKYTVDSDGFLRIHDVKKSDRGTYMCVGRNSFGVARKETYLLVKSLFFSFFIVLQLFLLRFFVFCQSEARVVSYGIFTIIFSLDLLTIRISLLLKPLFGLMIQCAYSDWFVERNFLNVMCKSCLFSFTGKSTKL